MAEASQKSYLSSVKIVLKEKLAGNRRFSASKCESGGSLARNARFGSFLREE